MLGRRTFGSFTIQRVHVNGNITMELRPGLSERINVRRVTPFHKPTKLGRQVFGPFTIQRVHVNRNITMELRPGLFEHINVRRVIPYHKPTMPPQ